MPAMTLHILAWPGWHESHHTHAAGLHHKDGTAPPITKFVLTKSSWRVDIEEWSSIQRNLTLFPHFVTNDTEVCVKMLASIDGLHRAQNLLVSRKGLPEIL